jgi:hypothetical protein
MSRLGDGHWSDLYLLIVAAYDVSRLYNVPGERSKRRGSSTLVRHWDRAPQLRLILNGTCTLTTTTKGQDHDAPCERIFRYIYGQNGSDPSAS